MKRRNIWIILVIIGLLSIGAAFALKYYNYIFSPNITSDKVLFIPSDANYQQVKDSLKKNGALEDISSFDWVAKKKEYPQKVKSGRYILQKGMNNNALVNMLRAGTQDPVKFTFNNLHTLNQLAGKLGEKLEADSAAFASHFNDQDIWAAYDMSYHTFRCLFIPDTYFLYWDISPIEFTAKMAANYNSFWNAERREKANQAGLTPTEVVTLASIVEQETKRNVEKPRIAGVYLNRLQRGMHLQADPTLLYAMNDYSIRRVLEKHKHIESDYNTYLKPGLPPGPICLPEKSSIQASLNAESHDYLYFCAKPDMSGLHNFAKSYRQHINFAKKYQNALNNRRIYR